MAVTNRDRDVTDVYIAQDSPQDKEASSSNINSAEFVKPRPKKQGFKRQNTNLDFSIR